MVFVTIVCNIGLLYLMSNLMELVKITYFSLYMEFSIKNRGAKNVLSFFKLT